MDDDTVRVVEQTGLVVLSRGELVVTADGSEAVLARVREEGLVLEFPVEVEVRIVPACDPDEHVDTTLARLTAALESLA
ncbi:hypothetical protein HH310_28825 [Actinoplanes sp. TBRC 11911]|uniref:hypothetical protein n=1 Tax=Actinoplanes sp. TBRC 11911 TaxID=2729386 RepID=UPI00145D9E2E|nr:hypothetical protein [Actinoplanes sp. TBRC 11911]NMO55176.1 hypothetical protein [Actinoplanes sp. TBRC 11911]